jgi:S1/P1 Nuclease
MELDLLKLLRDHPDWEERYRRCGDGSAVARRNDDDHDGTAAATTTCVREWGQESWHLALEYAYTRNDHPENDDDGGAVVEVKDGDELGEDYYLTRLPVVKERLVAGGVRLAATLEDIFGGGARSGGRDHPLPQELDGIRMWAHLASMR